MGPLQHLTRPDLDLLAAVHRRAREAGWHTTGNRGWLNADETINVGWYGDDGCVSVWRRDASTGLFPQYGTHYPVDTVRQGVDVLCALGILPADLSSQYAAGVDTTLAGATTRYDRTGDRWHLQWIAEQDAPGMTRADVESEYGSLTVDPPPADVDEQLRQPASYTVVLPEVFVWADRTLTIPAPHTADEIATVIHAELTSVGYAGIDVDVLLSTGTARITWDGDSLDATITGPGVAGRPARLTPAERIAQVAAIAPEYVRPVEAAR